MQRLDGHWIAKRVGILEHYKDMTLAEIVLFDAYLLLSNKQTGECWRSIRQLEEMLPMHRNTIVRAKNALIEKGWIEKVGQTGVFIPKLHRYSQVSSNEQREIDQVSLNEQHLSPNKQQGIDQVSPNKQRLSPNEQQEIDQVSPNKQRLSLNEQQKSTKEATIIEDDIIIDDPNSILGMPENSENSELCKLELPYLHLLKTIPGYPFNFEKDLSFIRDLLTDFPFLDILREIKNWKTWLLDKNLKGKTNYRSRLRRWLTNSIKYTEEQAHGKRGYNDGQSETYGKRSFMFTKRSFMFTKKGGVVGHPGRKGFDLPSDYPIDACDEPVGEDQDA